MYSKIILKKKKIQIFILTEYKQKNILIQDQFTSIQNWLVFLKSRLLKDFLIPSKVFLIILFIWCIIRSW